MSASTKFEKYIDQYDRTALGAGSQKDPATDRFSGLDVNTMFNEGKNLGLSDEDAYESTQDYFDSVKDETKHGGGTARALAKLRAQAQLDKDTETPVDPIEDPIKDPIEPDQDIAPLPGQTITAPVTGAPVTGGYLSPSMSVNQNNPVEIAGNRNQVDNSINQITSDMSNNGMFFGGTNMYMNTNPMLQAAVANMGSNSAELNGGASNTNINTLTGGNTSINFMNNFMRNRLFNMQ